jgi:hypothetical protein
MIFWLLCGSIFVSLVTLIWTQMMITSDWCTTEYPGQCPVWAWYFGSSLLALGLETFAFLTRKPLRCSTTFRDLVIILLVWQIAMFALDFGKLFACQGGGIYS